MRVNFEFRKFYNKINNLDIIEFWNGKPTDSFSSWFVAANFPTMWSNQPTHQHQQVATFQPVHCHHTDKRLTAWNSFHFGKFCHPKSIQKFCKTFGTKQTPRADVKASIKEVLKAKQNFFFPSRLEFFHKQPHQPSSIFYSLSICRYVSILIYKKIYTVHCFLCSGPKV